MSIFTAARRGLNALTSNDSNLANLISEEKDIEVFYASLKNSVASSSTYFTLWGTNEGEDLKDISSRMDVITKEFGLCFVELEDSQSRFREKLKDIQTLTNGVASLKAKIKACKDRLEKAIKNNKNAESIQAELGGLELHLKDENAIFENEKRIILKEAMIIQYDGIIRFSQKTKVIGEFGNHVAKQIPQINIKSGQDIPLYNAHDVTQQIVEDFEAELYNASKCIFPYTRNYVTPQLLNLDSLSIRQPTTSLKESGNQHDLLWDSKIESTKLGEEQKRPIPPTPIEEQPKLSSGSGWTEFGSTDGHTSLNGSPSSSAHNLPKDISENPW